MLFTSHSPYGSTKISVRLWPTGWYFDLARQVGSQQGELLRHWQAFPSSRDGSGRSGFLQSWISGEFCCMLMDILADKCDGWRVKCEGTQTLVRVRAVVCSQTKIPRQETLKAFIPGLSTWLNTIWFHLSEILLVTGLFQSDKYVILMVPHR